MNFKFFFFSEHFEQAFSRGDASSFIFLRDVRKHFRTKRTTLLSKKNNEKRSEIHKKKKSSLQISPTLLTYDFFSQNYSHRSPSINE